MCCGTGAESENGGWWLKCEKRSGRAPARLLIGCEDETVMCEWIFWGVLVEVDEGCGVFLEAFFEISRISDI